MNGQGWLRCSIQFKILFNLFLKLITFALQNINFLKKDVNTSLNFNFIRLTLKKRKFCEVNLIFSPFFSIVYFV